MKNWKTTLIGLITSALTLYAQGISPKSIAVASGIALLGIVAKDNNVTGGSVKQ